MLELRAARAYTARVQHLFITMQDKRITLVGIGCGSRTRTYMKLAMEHPEQFRIVAAADPVAVRAEQVRDFAPEEERAGIRLFANADELLSQPKMADVAIIGTQDDYHFEPARRALELGYDLLLEKPISKTLREALELRDLAEKLGRRVAICHVLRYTPFYNAIRNVIRSGELGEIMTFNANEGVGAWHFAHSFVRGHWGNSTKSTPITIRCAITVVSALPILVVYPFLQRYFVTGMVLGGVKG